MKYFVSLIQPDIYKFCASQPFLPISLAKYFASGGVFLSLIQSFAEFPFIKSIPMNTISQQTISSMIIDKG